MADPADDQSILAEIGLITLKWNDLEQAVERLIWYYLGSNEKGHIITGGMPNVTRLSVLKNLCDCAEAIPTIKTHILRFCECFDVLRLNRNKIVHSVGYGLSHAGDTFLFERLKKSIRTREYDTMALPLPALETLTEQIVGLTHYAQTLYDIMRLRSGLVDQSYFAWPKPPPWPDIFPLPDSLS